jgi:hypothetical protein
MPTEMSLTDFVFQTLIICGNREIVVKKAATNPIIVMNPNIFDSPTIERFFSNFL